MEDRSSYSQIRSRLNTHTVSPDHGKANGNGGLGTSELVGVTSMDNHSSSHVGVEADKKWNSVTSAVAQSTVPAWINVAVIACLIFGGCCSNVFTLEALIKDDPSFGTLITFAQFVIIAFLTFPTVFSPSTGSKPFFFKKPAVPLTSWAIYTAFFMSVNLLNNFAFQFKISVPLHIIIRSGGPVASMIIGFLYNSKTYTPMQVISVSILSVGVVVAAFADAQTKGKPLDLGLVSGEGLTSPTMTLAGFFILGLAMVLSAFQGVYADRLYQEYGRDNWREGLFYSHALSIPFLIPSYQHLLPQFKDILASQSVASFIQTYSATDYSSKGSSHSLILLRHLLNFCANQQFLQPIFSRVPIQLAYLILNALTQYICIRGVYLLSAKTSSLTVVIVLNIRKLVSLILSVYLFGNVLTTGVLAGAAMVFLGGGIYANEGARLRRQQSAKDKTI